MSATTQFIFGKVLTAFITILLFAPNGHAAERGIKRVRIAVSSKSPGILDTRGAKERDSISGAPVRLVSLARSIASSTRRSSRKFCANGDNNV